MNEFQLALVIGAAITALISSRLPRAWLWIALGAASFALSTAYARFGLPHAPAFVLSCDAAICLFIYFCGKEVWEERIYNIYQLSVLISLLHMSNFIGEHWLWVVILEGLNWSALLLISGTAILDRIKANGGSSYIHWLPHLHRSDLALRRSRSSQPFTRVRK